MIKNLNESMNIIMKKRRKKEPQRIFRGKNTCEMENSLDGVNSGLEESISELEDIAIETV